MSYEQRARGRSVSASELEAFGKTAARLSDTSGLSLTEAMVRTLEHESLNADQIRRAVEFCNITAVNSKYASMRDDRIVHIHGGPADPVAVIDALHATASAPSARLMALEYSAAPEYEKRSHALPRPAPDLRALHEKLSHAHDELVDMSAGVEFRMEMRFDELREAAKSAAREGASLCDLTTAWARHHPAMAKVAASQLRPEIPWGVKTASRSVNVEHPAMRKFASFAEAATELHRIGMARQKVEAELAEVAGFLARQVS